MEHLKKTEFFFFSNLCQISFSLRTKHPLYQLDCGLVSKVFRRLQEFLTKCDTWQIFPGMRKTFGSPVIINQCTAPGYSYVQIGA